MINDSIISSPSKSNESIRETRLKRKSKRKKIEQYVDLNCDQEQKEGSLHNLINALYKDSDDEFTEIDTTAKNSTFLITKPAAIIRNFKPFELEKILAMADRLIEQNNPSVLPKTQGFITCTTLNEADLTTEYCKATSKENNQNPSFITESELISCCNQAEQILENATPTEQYNVKLIAHDLTSSNNYNMQLVNSILEDFSQSPLRKGQIIESTSWQYTPEFRMRRRPVKNYSRKFLNSTKVNLNQRFEENATRNSSEYDDDHSSCSSLSVQEDLTFGENLHNQSTVANTSNTQRLCENLLNLTEYYTQNQSQISLSDEQLIPEQNDLCVLSKSQENVSVLHNVSDLITDILDFRSIYPNRILYGSYNSLDDFHGFSGKECVVDIDNNEQGVMNACLNSTHILNVCDVRHPNVNEIDNTRFNDWNEYDCQDIFSGINTENVLQQYNHLKNNEMVHYIPKSPKINKYFGVSEISFENPAPSNCTGFKTASSKPIKVSREANIVAAKILSKLPDIPEFEENSHIKNCDTKSIRKDVNIFENPEDYEWNDDCDFFLNFQTPIAIKENSESMIQQQQLLMEPQQEQDIPTTSKTPTLGFKTAAGENVLISNTAQKNVQKLLEEFECDVNNDFNYEDLKKIKCKIYAKTHNLQAKPSSLSDIKKLKTDLEFQISSTDQQNAKNLMGEVCLESEQNYEEGLEIMKRKIDRNIEFEKSITNENIDIKVGQGERGPLKTETSISNQFDIHMGFQTVNGTSIEISSKPQKIVQKLLEEFTKTPKEDYLNDLKFINNDANIINAQNSVIDKYTRTYKKYTFSENCEDLSQTYRNEEHSLLQHHNEKGNNLNVNTGFQTANGKNVFISAKAKQNVEKLLQEFKNISDIENYESDIKEMKTKIHVKYKNNEPKSVLDDNEYTKMVQNECPASPKLCNKRNFISKTLNGKRKNSTDNWDLESPNKTPPVKIFKNSLHSSKSSFAEQSLKSPLTSATRSLISRKNLLSLTKKRKSKRNSLAMPFEEIHKINEEICDLNLNTRTPNKSCISLKSAEQTLATPNFKEFFSNAPLASTPELNKPSKSVEHIQDLDLKPISWNNNNDSISNKSANDSMHSTKLSDCSALNITLNSSNPSVKERICRLKIYGKAPAVSPVHIETNHNCRPSGLRRTRSMIKKNQK